MTASLEEDIHAFITERLQSYSNTTSESLSNCGVDVIDESTLSNAGNQECTSDEVSGILLAGHSLSQYVSLLPVEHRKHVASAVISETVKWLSCIFR